VVVVVLVPVFFTFVTIFWGGEEVAEEFGGGVSEEACLAELFAFGIL
jgi:hypothetical protein